MKCRQRRAVPCWSSFLITSRGHIGACASAGPIIPSRSGTTGAPSITRSGTIGQKRSGYRMFVKGTESPNFGSFRQPSARCRGATRFARYRRRGDRVKWICLLRCIEPLMARNGRSRRAGEYLFLGAKRPCSGRHPMTEFDPGCSLIPGVGSSSP